MPSPTSEGTPLLSFNYSRLYDSNEKYSLQNMLMAQIDMPHEFHQGDKVWETWTDRLPYDALNSAWKLIESRGSGDHYLHDATAASLLAFAQSLNDQVNQAHSFKVTGLIIIRHTNVMSGYPTHRITMVGIEGNRKVYSGDSGPNVKGVENEFVVGRNGALYMMNSWQRRGYRT